MHVQRNARITSHIFQLASILKKIFLVLIYPVMAEHAYLC